MTKDEKLSILEEVFVVLVTLYAKEQNINRVNYLHHLIQNLRVIIVKVIDDEIKSKDD